MQLPGAALQFIKSIPIYGARLYEAFNAVQQQTTRIETQGNLNATGNPPIPPPPDALNVTNGPSGEFQIAITHNGEFNRGTTFHTQWDTSPHFTNPHNIDHGVSRNDSSLYLPEQTVFFRSSAASLNGANSAWTYHGSQNNPKAVLGGVKGPRAPGMGSGTGAPGDQSGGPGPIQSRNSDSGYNWKAQQRTTGTGVGSSAQGAPAGVGASTGAGSGGGGGGSVTLSETQMAAAETLTTIAGTGNAITGITVPAYSTRVTGFVLRYIPIHANSGATTINDNAIGVVAITDNGTDALVGGEFVVGKAAFLMWDGTRYQIVGSIGPIGAALLGSDAHGVPIVAPNSGVTAATYGDGTHVGQFTVTAQGQVTGAASVAITFPGSGTPTGPAGGGLNGTYPNPSVALISGAAIATVLIAALPVSPSTGQIASVSNALTPVIGTAVAGTGTAFAAVMWNGSQWTVFSV